MLKNCVSDIICVVVDLLVRLVGDYIVIDQDANSDPLFEALVDAGIPRRQIVLAYAGEAVPEILT